MLQLGHWSPGQALRCTPVTLAEATERGYSFSIVEGLLAAATGAPLPAEKRRQLVEWTSRQGTYRLRPVYLLSTKQPQQLAAVAADGRLRRHFQAQIAPRHAIVAPALIAPLGRWLAQRGFLLAAPPMTAESAGDPDAVYTWLGLRLLTGLAGLVELPFRPPYSSLAQAEARLEPQQLTDLEAQAEAIVDSLRAAIRGRDAFFPANEPADLERLALIQQALAQERQLDIAYQSLVDDAPHRRRVEPLRLEQRGALYYLHAYCHLAEADRVFRLDRIHACAIVETPEKLVVKKRGLEE
jgi:hypothetical protein